MNWWIIAGAAVAALGLGGFIFTRTKYFKVRKYAVDIKQVFDKHKGLEEKVQHVQAMGQNPNPLLVKKALRELIEAEKALIADLQKVKVPEAARELHTETLGMHEESLELYQLMLVGGMRQKGLEGRQRKLVQKQAHVQGLMEKLYGPMKKPEKK